MFGKIILPAVVSMSWQERDARDGRDFFLAPAAGTDTVICPGMLYYLEAQSGWFPLILTANSSVSNDGATSRGHNGDEQVPGSQSAFRNSCRGCFDSWYVFTPSTQQRAQPALVKSSRCFERFA